MFIGKDEFYPWYRKCSEDMSDYEIPEELAKELALATVVFAEIHNKIRLYIDEHPECKRYA